MSTLKPLDKFKTPIAKILYFEQQRQSKLDRETAVLRVITSVLVLALIIALTFYFAL